MRHFKVKTKREKENFQVPQFLEFAAVIGLLFCLVFLSSVLFILQMCCSRTPYSLLFQIFQFLTKVHNHLLCFLIFQGSFADNLTFLLDALKQGL